jgi:hypothetical protein
METRCAAWQAAKKGTIMQKRSLIGLAAIVAAVALVAVFITVAGAEQDANRLAVLWTSGDPDVAHRVCFMYTHAAKQSGWFDEIQLIVWGPSARLLAGDKDLQAKVKAMMDDGVDVKACVVCADSYGVSDQLRAMGIEVKGMGAPLTRLLKSDWEVLTF